MGVKHTKHIIAFESNLYAENKVILAWRIWEGEGQSKGNPRNGEYAQVCFGKVIVSFMADLGVMFSTKTLSFASAKLCKDEYS